jgi:hypothetical protein
MEFFNIICTSDNPILDRIFFYHKLYIKNVHQSPLLLVNKKLRLEYIDCIGNSIKISVDWTKHSLNGIGNFSEKLECFALKYIYQYSIGIYTINEINVIKEIIKLKNLSEISLENIQDCGNIVEKLDSKKIKYLSIKYCVNSKVTYHITNNFLNLKTLRLIGFCGFCSLAAIKNLQFLEELSIDIRDSRNLKYLTQIKNLKKLHLLVFCTIDLDSTQYLGKFKNLISLNLSSRVMMYHYAGILIEHICKNDSLESISLSSVYIGSDSLKLMIDKNLEELSLRKCRLYDVFDCLNFLKNNIERIKYFSFDVDSNSIDENNTKIANYLSFISLREVRFTRSRNFVSCSK